MAVAIGVSVGMAMWVGVIVYVGAGGFVVLVDVPVGGNGGSPGELSQAFNRTAIVSSAENHLAQLSIILVKLLHLIDEIQEVREHNCCGTFPGPRRGRLCKHMDHWYTVILVFQEGQVFMKWIAEEFSIVRLTR